MMIPDGTTLTCGHAKDGVAGYVKRYNGDTLCMPCNEQRRRNAYRPEVLRRERRNLSECIGFTTLVGVMGFATVNGPCPKCGHDHVADPKCTRWGDGVRAECSVNGCGAQLPVKDPFPLAYGNCCDILNMNSENAEHIVKIMPAVAVDCEVEIVKWGRRERVRVVDPRIPDGYKHHVCGTCNTYEDGVTPYAPTSDGDTECKNTGGTSVVEFRGKPRKLKSTWSMEETIEVGLSDE
jgi:hypothetical protein